MFTLCLAQRQLLSILSTAAFFFHEVCFDNAQFLSLFFSLRFLVMPIFILLIGDDKTTKVFYDNLSIQCSRPFCKIISELFVITFFYLRTNIMNETIFKEF